MDRASRQPSNSRVSRFGDLVARLKAIVSSYEHQVILAPYPGMKTRIALTAWTRLDRFEEFDEKRIVRFIEAYRGIDHHKR